MTREARVEVVGQATYGREEGNSQIIIEMGY